MLDMGSLGGAKYVAFVLHFVMWISLANFGSDMNVNVCDGVDGSLALSEICESFYDGVEGSLSLSEICECLRWS
jgi:hypothetical protein